MSPIDPTLFQTYQAERHARRNVARDQLPLHTVLDDQDLADVADPAGGSVRANRINLALLARYMRARDWPVERVQAALRLSAKELELLTSGGLIVGQEAAAAIDAELAERFKESPANERDRKVDEARRERTIKRDTARRRLYSALDG